MKNKEKFFNELIDEVYEKGYTCDFIEGHCDFKCIGDTQKDCDVCKEKLKKWLEQEHIEKPRLSHDEYVILKNMDGIYDWIARNNGDKLFIFEEKPHKYNNWWNCKHWSQCYYLNLFNRLFQFVKWEDEEPYNIQKLLDEYETYHNETVL